MTLALVHPSCATRAYTTHNRLSVLSNSMAQRYRVRELHPSMLRIHFPYLHHTYKSFMQETCHTRKLLPHTYIMYSACSGLPKSVKEKEILTHHTTSDMVWALSWRFLEHLQNLCLRRKTRSLNEDYIDDMKSLSWKNRQASYIIHFSRLLLDCLEFALTFSNISTNTYTL